MRLPARLRRRAARRSARCSGSISPANCSRSISSSPTSKCRADFPSERRFWFEPLFHPGQSALLHKQPDNIYRIDLQLGWDADPEEEKKPERVIPRLRKALGRDDFRLDWVSVYTFQCRRLEKFVHGRIVFAGDSAHIVSPFGARGGNGGLQDVDALGWRLAAVLHGKAEAVIARRL